MEAKNKPTALSNGSSDCRISMMTHARRTDPNTQTSINLLLLPPPAHLALIISHLGMPDVPLELLQVIATDLESESALFQLRLVSKTLNSVATPLAFRVVTVRDSVKSAEALSFLQGCDGSITSAIREIIFQGDPEGSPDNGYGWIGESRSINVGDTSGEAGRKVLKTAFSGLAKLTNLEHLRFDFHGSYEEESTHEIPDDPTHFLRLQLDLFAALAVGPPPSMVSLTLNNVLAFPDPIYAQEDFHSVFRSLQTLHISVLSDVEYEGSYFQEPLVEFWDESVAHMVRSAAALTSLTIQSDQAVGAGPFLSFMNTFLPNLTSLTLESFALEPWFPESDVVAFIVAHKATLTHLELRGCSIDGGVDSDFPRPWHAVLALFEAELGCLRTFVLDDSDEDGEGPFAYTRLDRGFGYMSVDEAVDGAEGDAAALESLLLVVKSRRGAAGRMNGGSEDGEDDDS
ncbi:hypothetical protein DFH09DRAFT_1337230 [Mycena vulgaris]|nr:hypothetical protein DFH09DRAFT_1337230 [Mycena vulgaris]